MWEPEFANKSRWEMERRSEHLMSTTFPRECVSRTRLLYWREHCLECAPPECYHTCPIYEQREDKRCIRFQYGIYPNSQFKGLFEFGADVRFKRWAKLGTHLYPALLTPVQHRFLQKSDMAVAIVVRSLFRLTNRYNPNEWFNIRYNNPQRVLFKLYAYIRENMIRSIMRMHPSGHVDSFVMECFSFAEQPFRMQLEYSGITERFRNSFLLSPGNNCVEIPFQAIVKNASSPGSFVVYPENDLAVRVVFTWLDLIEKQKKVHREIFVTGAAEKIKCVAWDLDNTLWKGVLIETEEKKVTIPIENISCIKKLDERGILQTIISKNDHNVAWKIIEKNKLQDYFIYPAINWAPKSVNLKKIAEKINIGIDTFALIDDSPFERAEVNTALPQVRIYDEKEISNLLLKPEFDVPVTDTSKSRRKSYLIQLQREHVQEEYGDNLTAFLKSCSIKMKIFIPKTPEHINRCLELVQRSNQLNLSSKRYTREQFLELLNKPDSMCLAFHCTDRFGDYGIVGFSRVNETPGISCVTDLVISCRIAQKRVEHAFIEWLAIYERSCGHKEIHAKLMKTNKNGPLQCVFKDLPFVQVYETTDSVAFSLTIDPPVKCERIVEVTDELTGNG